jgi:hypothetical protein
LPQPLQNPFGDAVVRIGLFKRSAEVDRSKSARFSPRNTVLQRTEAPFRKMHVEGKIMIKPAPIARLPKSMSPLGSRQSISDHQAEPEFQENYKRLKADRLAREAAERAPNSNATAHS